jgi:glycosyltransferase involved in cell wall biosynthesis
VPSEAVADDLASSGHPIEGRPVEVIPWGSDHLPDPDEPGCDDLLRSLGVDGPFLLSVSTIQPRKNLGRLIEAFELARASLAGPMTLLVVGPDGWGGGVRAGEGVVLAGRVDDAVLAALYRRAVLFLFVSLSEGFGLPVVEAMHAGTAVVSSDVPSAGRSTLLVDPLDVTSIRDGIVDLVSDDAARAALAATGRATAAARTWSTVALRHLELWRSLGAELPAP